MTVASSEPTISLIVEMFACEVVDIPYGPYPCVWMVNTSEEGKPKVGTSDVWMVSDLEFKVMVF